EILEHSVALPDSIQVRRVIGVDDARGHEDHQVGTAGLEIIRPEKPAEDRDVGQPRNAREPLGTVDVHQAGDDDGLPVADIGFGFRATGEEARYAHHRYGRVDLADLGHDGGGDLVVLVDERLDVQLDAVVLELHVGGAESVGQRDRHLASGEEVRFAAAARAQLGRSEFIGVAVPGQQVDLRADRGGDAEIRLHRADLADRQGVDVIPEWTAFREKPVRRKIEVLDTACERALDDAVPADPEVAQRIALELHDPHVHQHHRLHGDQIVGSEVHHVRVEGGNGLQSLGLDRGEFAHHQHLAVQIADFRRRVRPQHLADQRRGGAAMAGTDLDVDRPLAAVLVPDMEFGIAVLVGAGDHHQLALVDGRDLQQIAITDGHAVDRARALEYEYLAAVEIKVVREGGRLGANFSSECQRENEKQDVLEPRIHAHQRNFLRMIS